MIDSTEAFCRLSKIQDSLSDKELIEFFNNLDHNFGLESLSRWIDVQFCFDVAQTEIDRILPILK